MKLDFSKFEWLNQPSHYELTGGNLRIRTDPGTDFWQRTYYDFRHNNAHAFVTSVPENTFSFTVKTSWEPVKLFDQCGVVLFQDEDNWFKASVEYDNPEFSRLGSVVTNLGYSDWATTDIRSGQNEMTYRLSRRGQDFLIENAFNGSDFHQMRIFHMHLPLQAVRIGVYACSPLNSTMRAEFSGLFLGQCEWPLFENPDKPDL